ncbi:hypothetical protein McpSp1_16190 [Methanocorpusculaceae archaeon Sp1]|nr:hypothetical protein [Methanocorpusculaceae archaeon Sp1]
MNKQILSIPFFSGFINRKYLTIAILALLTILFFSAGCVNTLPEQNNSSLINPSEMEQIDPFNISGIGSYQSDVVYLSNIITVLAEVSGAEPFILSLQNENGTQTLLFNEPGSSSGERLKYFITSREIPSENYTLNIISGRDWNIFLSSGTKAQYLVNESYPGYITGSGSQNISLPPTSSGLTVLQGYGSTLGYISVGLIVNGTVVQQMDTDATGLIGLQAAYPLKTSDTVALNIVSDSEWVFEITQPAPGLPMVFENLVGRGNYVSAFYVFDRVENQELVFSNAGNTSIEAKLYTENGTVAAISIPAKTNAYHYCLYQNPQQIIPVTALIAVTAKPDCEWLVEWCDYRLYFHQVSPENISGKTVSQIQEKDLLDFPVLQRFADTGFTAAYVPVSDSEIHKLMATNYTIIEFAGNYYSLSIAG